MTDENDLAKTDPALENRGSAKSAGSDTEQAKPAKNEARRSNRPTADSIFLEELIPQLSKVSAKLRELIPVAVLVKIIDRAKAYVVDISSTTPTVVEYVSGKPSAAREPECKISMNEANLVRLWNGELNPQIALLSDKVAVEGKKELAVYFFNILSPRTRI